MSNQLVKKVAHGVKVKSLNIKLLKIKKSLPNIFVSGNAFGLILYGNNH